MRLPAPLLRRKKNVHKNSFGHVLILAGSPGMLGAAALASLAAMRSGAGLVTLGIPKSLNLAVQKKIAPVIMTWPLPETRQQTLSLSAYTHLIKQLSKFDAIALGPGLSLNHQTQRLILKLIENSTKPLIIDADGLNAVSKKTNVLNKNKSLKILTPHPGEMMRLTGETRQSIEKNRKKTTIHFAKDHQCIVLLKGNKTIVANPQGRAYLNPTGNSGMATAGSGDVLTGMIAAFIAQGLSGFDAAKWGAYLHGLAADLAARDKTRLSLIASDIIDYIPSAIRRKQR